MKLSINNDDDNNNNNNNNANNNSNSHNDIYSPKSMTAEILALKATFFVGFFLPALLACSLSEEVFKL